MFDTDRQKFGFFHPNVPIIIKTVFFSLCLLTAARIIFLLKYLSFFRGVGSAGIIHAMATGVRFDLSTTFLLYTIFFIALILPGKWSSSKIYLGILRHIIALFFLAEIFVLAVDIGYYRFVNRHLAFELMDITHDTAAMLKIMFTEYLGYVLLIIAFAAGAYIVLGKIFKTPEIEERRFGNFFAAAGIHTLRSVANFLVLAALTVVFIRGGFQHKPLRTSYAFTSDKMVLGHLALNGVYTSLQAYYKTNNRLEVPYDYNAAVAGMQKLLSDKNSRFLNKEYPLFRENIPAHKISSKPNVVIFILESWSGDAIGALGAKYGVTPYFDRLSKKGLLLTNCFSVGQRSVDAVMSVLMSFPSSAACQAVGKVYEQNNMIGIGNILKERGYSSVFICGANRGSMGFDAFAKKAGFERYIAKDDFKLPKKDFDGTWGVFDGFAFERANEEFSKMKKPFFGVLYTLNPHAPYTIPSDKFKKYNSGKDAPFLNALNYCDWSLGRFFELAKKSPYFKNTLFVIVADHPEGHHEKGFFDHFHIPCLFYYPGKLAPGRYDKVSSQLAIMPSIIDLLGLDCAHSSFAKSIFRKNSDFAYMSNGNIFGWFMGKFAYLRSLDKPIGMYNWKQDHNFTRNLLGSAPAVEKTYGADAKAAMKMSTELLYNNRIAPLKH